MQIIKKTMTQSKAVLTAYLLDSSKEMDHIQQRPAILIFPGGGYHFVSMREAEPVAMKYAAEGFQTFVLSYTVGAENEFSDAFQDAKSALEMIRDNGEAWQVDEESIAVLGFSAGGHLAAAVASMTDKKERPNALLLGYPCIYSKKDGVLAFDVPSVNEYVDKDTPNTFLFSTYADDLVAIDHSLQFLHALHKQSIPFESHIFQKGAHGLSLGNSLTSSGFPNLVNESFQQWFNLSILWLKQLFGDFKINKITLSISEIDAYSIKVPIHLLMDHKEAKDIVLNYLPNLINHEKYDTLKEHSIIIINSFLKKPLDEGILEEIDNQLKAINLH